MQLFVQYPTQKCSLPSYNTAHYYTEVALNAALGRSSVTNAIQFASTQPTFLTASVISFALHLRLPSDSFARGFWAESKFYTHILSLGEHAVA